MKHDDYKNLLDVPYVSGDHDCYGLGRRFYAQCYDLELRDYARPDDFAFNGKNLIYDNLEKEGFKIVDVSLDRLQPGDGILMNINDAPLVNHLGYYVGNNLFIHHLFQLPSCEHNFSRFWRKKVSSIVRHPQVEEQNRTSPPDNVLHLLDLLPPHVRRNFTPT